MTLKRFMTFATLIAIIFVPLFSSPVDAQTYFSDDFGNPAESEDKWEVIAGDWQVADGVYHQLSTADPWLTSMVAADKWSDEWVEYTIEFMVRPLTEGDAPVNVLFRVQDPVPPIWADRSGPNTHMYRWIVNGWTNTESRPYMYNAGTNVMLAQTNNSLEVGSWHKIKLVVTQTGLAGYVDEVEMFDLEHAQWTNGRVGIQAYSGIMDFDDFIVYGPAGRGAFPYASGPNPPDGAINLDTWVELNWRPGDFAVTHDVYLGDSLDEVNNGTPGAPGFQGNQAATTILAGFPGFAFPDGLVPGTTYYWRIDEVNDADPNSPWRGDIWSFSIPPKTAYSPDPVDGAEFVDPNAILTWTGGYGSKLHTVYLGDNYDDVNNAVGGMPLGPPSYDPGTLEQEKVLYWRVDEFDGFETHKGDIWAFTTPGAVGNPQPANGAVDVQMIETLSWTPADRAASHHLYFGTDKDAVNNATTASPEHIGARALGAESYEPGGLAWNSGYAWRVDEVYPNGTFKGLVWTFTTADFILVDDFESYDDIDPLPGEPGINRIFDKWVDGFGTTTNGALVGNDLPPYAETTIVHGGAQSLVYRYDNNLKTSEATLTLVYPRDWSEQGVTKLSLWFRGASGNAADRMFVALGNAVVYHDDASATQLTGWNKWVIELQEFAGVNLTNVNTITIG
ncbi:MAG: hypothetical protein ISS70_21845, partial [Phycisphaerae bacterium]|nr:hypothetical protein [Phycisphaerae bacterium]